MEKKNNEKTLEENEEKQENYFKKKIRKRIFQIGRAHV